MFKIVAEIGRSTFACLRVFHFFYVCEKLVLQTLTLNFLAKRIVCYTEREISFFENDIRESLGACPNEIDGKSMLVNGGEESIGKCILTFSIKVFRCY